MSTPQKFRKKPLVVEAMRYVDDDSAERIYDWTGAAFYYENGRQQIDTREGVMEASVGDWIIKEPNPTDDRRFYPCKPDIFAATYEPVESD